MFDIFLETLVVAWALSFLFGAPIILSNFIFEWFGKKVSSATYYVLAAIIGLIISFCKCH